MMLTKKSTARTLLIGPILDSAGAAVTTEVVGSLRVTKNGTVSTLNASATLTHDHSGMYRLALTTSDTDTVGVCQISLTSGTNAMAPVNLTVVETAVYDALFAASAAGYQVPIWAAANSTVNLSGTTVKAVTDAPADSAGVTAIKAKTDNLPGDPADASDVAAAFATVNSSLATIAAYIDTEVAAIKAKTDNLPATPASTSDIPSAATNAAAVRTQLATELARIDVATSTRLAGGSYTAPLDAAGTRSALGMAAADLDTQLDAILANTGAGAYTRTITVNDGTTALQNAKVRLSQGAETRTGTTNASGQVVFGVDGATWDVAITKDGYQFTPTTLVVSGSGSTTYSMTVSGPTPSADPDKTTVRITCYGADTEPEASATVQLRQTTIPSGDTGNAFDGDWTTYTTDENGVVDLTLWTGAEYALRRGAAGPITKFTPTGASYAVSSVVGKSA